MILIATPTRDTVNSKFTYDLVNLVKESPDTAFAISEGSLLPNLRSLLVKAAQKAGATHILFIDSDMRFPADTVKRLLAHNVDIVGANCKQRTQNEWTARKDGKFISSEGKTGLEEVDTLGFGVTLIKLSVFEKLSEPYFHTPFDTQERKHVGEDVYFSTIVKESGLKIFIDHDISKQVKHAGLVEFGI